jgi:D-alanine transaminase
MTPILYLNGEFLPKDQALVPVDDRGLVFGDGVYEVTRSVNGHLFEWPRHASRLQRSLKEMKLYTKLSTDEIEKLSLELLLRNKLTTGEAYVYLQVTRGVAPRTHQFPPEGTECTVFMSAAAVDMAPIDEKRAKGVGVITTPDIRWTRCDIKSVNLIPAVLAKQAAVEADCEEALFVRNGVITEGSSTNAFAVIDGYLRTYPSSNYILPGVTRAVVLEIAREQGLKVSEAPLHMSDIPRFQEFFITGTISGILPVVAIDDAKIATGRPGPITLKLYEALAARIYGKNATKTA